MFYEKEIEKGQNQNQFWNFFLILRNIMEKKLIFEETHRLLFYGLMFFLYFSVFAMLFLRKSHEKIAFYRTFDSNLCLSRINLYILIGYHFLSMTNAFLQAFICTIPPKSDYLNMMSNFLFIALVFPISAVSLYIRAVSVYNWLYLSTIIIKKTVTVGFCNACLFYGEFLCPKVNGEKMRCWQNYIIHILPLPAALLDFLFTRHYYNHSQIVGCLPTVVFVTVYFLWFVREIIISFRAK